MRWEELRSLDRLQLFARLETNRLTRRNINLLARAGVTANACFARFHVEDTEATKLDSATAAQCTFHCFKNRLHSLLGLSARYVGTADNRVHNIELDHARLLLQ